jgi:hypothetical protein
MRQAHEVQAIGVVEVDQHFNSEGTSVNPYTYAMIQSINLSYFSKMAALHGPDEITPSVLARFRSVALFIRFVGAAVNLLKASHMFFM